MFPYPKVMPPCPLLTLASSPRSLSPQATPQEEYWAASWGSPDTSTWLSSSHEKHDSEEKPGLKRKLPVVRPARQVTVMSSQQAAWRGICNISMPPI